jgi:hypothetical protein
MSKKTLREQLEEQMFIIAQALVISGKHTNPYELAREAFEITVAVKDETEQFVLNLLSKDEPEPVRSEWVLGEPKPDDWD